MSRKTSPKPPTLLQWLLLQWMAKPYSGETTPGCRITDERITVYPGEFNAEALRCCRYLLARGWLTEPDQFGNRWLNEDGKRAARELPQPSWSPPAPRGLRDEDFEVLGCLERDAWRTPLDCGGSSRSPHSAILTVLTLHGLAECRRGDGAVSGPDFSPRPRLGTRAKGSRRFRLTAAGESALSHHWGREPKPKAKA